MAKIEIDAKRLAKVKSLNYGSHSKFSEGMCAMEAVAYIAREPMSDQPKCASKVIGAFMRSWNDALDDQRSILLPLIPLMVGTAGSAELEQRRSLMAADWLIRVHAPAWLRLAKLTGQAALLEALPEITAMAQVPAIRGPIEAVRKDAAVARAVAAAAAVAGSVAWAVAAVAGDAGAVAWDAAGVAARDVAGDVARDALRPTCDHLQASAVDLVKRMCALIDEKSRGLR